MQCAVFIKAEDNSGKDRQKIDTCKEDRRNKHDPPYSFDQCKENHCDNKRARTVSDRHQNFSLRNISAQISQGEFQKNNHRQEENAGNQA